MKKWRTNEERLDALELKVDRKLNFREHMSAQVVELPEVYSTTANLDVLLDPARIKGRPLGVLVIEVMNVAAPESPGSISGSPKFFYFTPGDGNSYLRFTEFPGLAANTQYRVTLLVLGGG